MNIIDLYINNLRKDDILLFANKHNINLNSDELDFTYSYIKNNYKEVLNNKDRFNFDEYKEKFSEENFYKIKELINTYINYL